jgi:hypothetical protein
MKNLFTLALLGAVFSVVSPPITNADVLLMDRFEGNAVNAELWHIPTWQSPTDGTFLGRTQFRVTQHSGLPPVRGGKVAIDIESFNPTAPIGQPSFYGCELISNVPFHVGRRLDVKVRARMKGARQGIVGGIFLYALNDPVTTDHDEIDFELLTDKAYRSQVQTNVYANQPLGAGDPKFEPLPNPAKITAYHEYEIEWRPNSVSWFIDGKRVRTEADNVPRGPMYFYLNDWAPDGRWPQAYYANLRPVSSQSANRILNVLEVDSVRIEQE